MESKGSNQPYPIFPYFIKPPQKFMDITKLIGDLGFPIVISLILIYKLDYKLDEILKEIRELKNEN